MKTGVFIAAAVFLFGTVAWAKIGGGDITFSPSGAGEVVYSHEAHVLKAGLRCTECHYRIFNPNEARKPATMADMSKGESCGACHDGKRAFDVKANCRKCHK